MWDTRQTDGRTDGRTDDIEKLPPVLQDIILFGAAAQKKVAARVGEIQAELVLIYSIRSTNQIISDLTLPDIFSSKNS